jgi:hypothetical protein
MITQQTRDFVKSLIESKILAPETESNELAMETIQQITQMTEQEAMEQGSRSVILIHSEFTDWIETYKGQN